MREVQRPESEARALYNLMRLWKALDKPAVAIFYGKQTVNVYQQMRANIQGLDQSLQKSFLASKEDAYRDLADLLISEGRLPEAQQVLDLLKEEEYREFIRRAATNVNAANSRLDLTPEEAALDKHSTELSDQVMSLGKRYAELLAKKERTAEEEQLLSRLQKEMAVAAQSYRSFLDGLFKEFGRNADAAQKVQQLEGETKGMKQIVRDLGPGVVALYTLVRNDNYRVIVITPHVIKAHEYPIKVADLNNKVQAFRKMLQQPDSNPLPLAQELYKILVGPVVKDLEGAGAETIMWSLDRALRYLPMSALHDGHQYMVEKYRNVVITPASIGQLKDEAHEWNALGLGSSKNYDGMGELSYVPDELRGIIHEEGREGENGVLPGKLMLDDAFTEDSMTSALRQKYKLVHIASHFSLKPADINQSFLLLGNGKHLTLAQLRDMPDAFSDVELLTLSACDTAMGTTSADGREIDGLGILAQQEGAKAVIASLWRVNDKSTMYLMHRLYQLRGVKPNVAKAESLRQAQLALLRGTEKGTAQAISNVSSASAVGGKQLAQPQTTQAGNALYAHPYYWAPFILIGNWR
jgi:CHAT domain-containing protein